MFQYIIYPIHNGVGLSFSDWVSLLTLCFAPLIAHVVAGVPHSSYLYDKRPKWHERICLYNPTSIMWRYFSILDRRLRTRMWSRFDLAATNAVFWTERGWDGSQQMITRSLPHCTYLPSHSQAEIFSDETFKSIVTALQGIQAAQLFISSFTHDVTDLKFLGADLIFYPLAALGLFRLFAAPWLSNDFKYTSRIGDCVSFNVPLKTEAENRVSLDSLLHSPDSMAMTQDRHRQVSCWQSRLLRASYITLLLAIWFLTILWVFPIPYNVSFAESYKGFTITSFCVAVFYLVMIAVSLAVHGHYFIKGQTTSTVIPCASYLWYKVYTIILFVSMAFILIVSFFETTKTVCGKFTSFPVASADAVACEGRDTRVWHINASSTKSEAFGIALRYPYAVHETVLKEGEFWVWNCTATCIGRGLGAPRTHAMTLDAVDFKGIIDWGNGTATEVAS
ncbi:hypothetical protein GGR58DRAFT_146433 [Xylaria digitata]|nr:hypothetical protein GGR58DRAFT_146433 [Xylaria digitata]